MNSQLQGWIEVLVDDAWVQRRNAGATKKEERVVNIPESMLQALLEGGFVSGKISCKTFGSWTRHGRFALQKVVKKRKERKKP